MNHIHKKNIFLVKASSWTLLKWAVDDVESIFDDTDQGSLSPMVVMASH